MATFESRKLFRADAVVKIEFTKKDDPDFKGVGYSKNMSQTGLNILTDKVVAKGSEICLNVHIENSATPVKAKGVVIWQAECSFVPESKRKYYFMGVQINDMSSKDAIRESDYVKDFLVRKSEEQNKEIIQRLEETPEK
jgi:Tfp pilus assembly protein PilZ